LANGGITQTKETCLGPFQFGAMKDVTNQEFGISPFSIAGADTEDDQSNLPGGNRKNGLKNGILEWWNNGS